ncbi:MAG: 4-hydroxybenzoate octaprenyltransferase [Verrucomicrobiales bacterium]|nr:4-hydroxybenzoate octaprenyltransferase [Verrucomicrobiales bacterium]MEC7882666.1 UbiA-like polyprenyltransferase [Verrucomicrobiota bacterium]|tara:strand:- start:262 stop:1281 length:1020 start_codon:yes stop_codon:yes gene_type:complete
MSGVDIINKPKLKKSGFFGLLLRWGQFVKFSHTIFAMPFALASMMVASREHFQFLEDAKADLPAPAVQYGFPGLKLFILIILCMVCARTAAMAFNRIVDRDYDAKNPRTANRHLPTGEISLFSAWLFFSLSAAGFLVSAGFINNACLFLSPVALFFICFYSLTKRFTDYTHVWLGVALALAPIGAWIAVKGGTTAELFHLWPLSQSLLPPLILGVAVVFWLIGFDIIYAIQDFEFDKQNGLRSLVTAWGPKNALTASFLSHMIMLALILLFGIMLKMRVAFLIGWLIILFCLLFEHWIARKRSLKWVNTAFFKLNALISSVFFFVVATEVLFPFFRRIQ